MTTDIPCKPKAEMTLYPRTAAELMTPNPLSIGQDATALEAASFLTGRGISAAPVIDGAGRPVGVVSRSDILVPYQMAPANRTLVRSIMTPTVFCVRCDAPARKVVEMMVDVGVRRVFVVDESNVLVGVISALDVLRHLCRGGRRASRGR